MRIEGVVSWILMYAHPEGIQRRQYYSAIVSIR
jgi:hypothetical protein